MPQQQTLRESVSLEGIGLHSGNRVRMTFLPAPANSGVRFRRVDLDGRPEIEARVENVSDTTRSTTISKGPVRIHTVEHVLATFAGYGIDNVTVELNANEPPIADGSSRVYCQMVEEAGIVPQAEKRETFPVITPVEIQVGESTMSVFPHDRFKITCTSADRRGFFTQFFSLEVNPETWARDLAHARTFCFYEEIEFLFRNGLIKGGSLENAVVIRDDAVLTNEPLRYPEEFVRHKILDIVGDLSLVGAPILGHVTAVRPSHTANCELARHLVQQLRKPARVAQTFAPPPPAGTAAESASMPPADGVVYDTMGVMRLLPHRYPFLMVDKVIKHEGNKITAVKNVSINEPYFQGHFPGHPIMPGVLQLEAMAQVAGIMMLTLDKSAGRPAYFMSAESVKWRKPVRPGDVLIIEVELTKARGRIGKGKGRCFVGTELVSEAEVTFMILDETQS